MINKIGLVNKTVNIIKNMIGNYKRLLFRVFIFTSLITIFIVGTLLFYNSFFLGKIYKNIFVAGIDLGGMDTESAEELLKKTVTNSKTINIIYSDKKISLKSEDISLNYKYKASVIRAFSIPRTGNIFTDSLFRIKLLFIPIHTGLLADFDTAALKVFVDNFADTETNKPKYPFFKKKDSNIYLDRGSKGTELDKNKLEAAIINALIFNSSDSITAPFVEIDPTLSDLQIANAQARAQNYLDKSIEIAYLDKKFVLDDALMLSFLDPAGGYYVDNINTYIEQVSNDIDKAPQLPKFVFDGNRVSEFLPAENGAVVNKRKTFEVLISKLDEIRSSANTLAVDLPVDILKSPIATEDVNNLGIKELIGTGTSTYNHSIPSRIYNIDLAASRVNGTLVAPGETFSFNKSVGDISKLTGYKEAYVISQGKTILGDGGGVCQVSSTLFRAVLNSGLPVDERRSHTYRVGYYEQNSPPGLDATIYSPTTDFKFTNDTANYILIQAVNDPANFTLVFNLYGTSDGRISTVTRPVVSNYSPPPPPIYQDDPNLPNGTIKQIDYAAAGAKVTFNYSVTRNNVVIYRKTFVSNYLPWPAVYLKGTKI